MTLAYLHGEGILFSFLVHAFFALLGGGVIVAICVPLFRKENTLESSIIEETEWDLLLRRSRYLLPFQRDQELAIILAGDGVDHVLANAEAFARVRAIDQSFARVRFR